MTVDLTNTVYELGMVDTALLKMENKQREARAAGREGSVHPYNGLVSLMMQRSVDVLKVRMLKTAGRSSVGVVALRTTELDLHKVCAIAARTVVDGISHGHRLQTITERIGTRIEDEVRMREFRAREPNLFKWMGERFKERGSEDYRHKRRVLMGALRRADSEEVWQTWDTKTRAGVGLLVLDAQVQAGFIETLSLPVEGKGRSILMVKLTAEAEAALTHAGARGLEMLQPWYKPMLEEPAEWSNPNNGGYMTVDLPIMKTRKRQDIERLANADMPVVYAALNAVQRTPWKINEDVLVVAEEMRRMRVPVKGLPDLRELTRPDRPELPPIGEELSEAEKVILSKFKGDRRAWFNAEAQRRSKTTQSTQILEIAHELRGAPNIYFPHQIDYRGRAYAVPLQLNPQGNDLSKGLLTFAKGRELGNMGAFWLAFHGANTFGVDKGPINDRVDWTLEHSDEIEAVAADPLTNQWWTEADGGNHPWQFLAFCFEWAGYLQAEREGREEFFVSYLPVSVDGSCNGIQHFSAMLRDQCGAVATNLTASDEQHDIYTEVLERTMDAVDEVSHIGIGSAEDREFAGIWLEAGVERKDVKRPVMTTPYGVTAIGMKQMIIDDTLTANPEANYGEAPWLAADWLSKRIYGAIGVTVSAAQGAMTFLQDMARATSKDNQPISWTTPTGLPVVQHIMQSNSFMIETTLLGRVRLRYAEYIDKMDKRKQKTSITPNFVHSYDAAHLMMTVVATEDELERPLSWAMVHDSYGTHAGDVHTLSRVLREQFHKLYSENEPLEELRDRVAASLPEGTELPSVPPKGSYDLDEVLKAEFFFS